MLGFGFCFDPLVVESEEAGVPGLGVCFDPFVVELGGAGMLNFSLFAGGG